MVSYTKARAESELRDFNVGFLERAERIVILVVGAVFGWMPLAIGVVAVGSTVTAGQRFALAHRRLGELDARDAQASAGEPAALGDVETAEGEAIHGG